MLLTQVAGPITFEKLNVFAEQALVEVEPKFSGDSFRHDIKVESPQAYKNAAALNLKLDHLQPQ